jgi:hypothetical protein
MPGQIVLDPKDTTTAGQWTPPGPIPPPLRQFGRFPDVSKWLPGDLVLFSTVHPGWISRSIIRGQERGGYALEDARWHHAAVYLGDGISICEATRTRVKNRLIYPYLGGYLLRIRRDIALTPDERWQIAMQSLTRLGSPYSFWNIFWLTLQSFRGFWQPSNSPPPFGGRAVICSQLFSDSYSMVTGRLLVKTPSGIVKPADLSFAPQLTDVATTWLRI